MFSDQYQAAGQQDTSGEAINSWHTISQKLEYDGDHAKVFTERVRTPSRPHGVTWTVVQRKSAVVIAARTINAKWLLIRQERIAIQQTIWEFPAGQIEGDPRRDYDLIVTTAWRELREETGWQQGPDTVLTSLGLFYPSAGFTDEKSHLYLVEDLVPYEGGVQHDEAEGILEVREFSTSELTTMIAVGEIRDANTLAAFARLSARGLLGN